MSKPPRQSQLCLIHQVSGEQSCCGCRRHYANIQRGFNFSFGLSRPINVFSNNKGYTNVFSNHIGYTNDGWSGLLFGGQNSQMSPNLVLSCFAGVWFWLCAVLYRVCGCFLFTSCGFALLVHGCASTCVTSSLKTWPLKQTICICVCISHCICICIRPSGRIAVKT